MISKLKERKKEETLRQRRNSESKTPSDAKTPGSRRNSLPDTSPRAQPSPREAVTFNFASFKTPSHTGSRGNSPVPSPLPGPDFDEAHGSKGFAVTVAPPENTELHRTRSEEKAGDRERSYSEADQDHDKPTRTQSAASVLAAIDQTPNVPTLVQVRPSCMHVLVCIIFTCLSS